MVEQIVLRNDNHLVMKISYLFKMTSNKNKQTYLKNN